MTLEVSNIVCPTCGSPDHMHHLVGANVGYWNMKCFNCNSYFNFDELYKHRKVIKSKTNADRIRAMTDEELAKTLNVSICPPGYNEIWACEKEEELCHDCWLDWLKQEAMDGT